MKAAHDKKPQPSDRWRIAIDTGGTFTDALGVDPSGTLRRAKVLSSSALRGRVVTRTDAAKFSVLFHHALPEGFLNGFQLQKLGSDDSVRIDDHGSIEPGQAAASPQRLCLAAPLELEPGDTVQATSPEEAPVLAARLLTMTPPGQPLPPLELRLATTRGTNALLERRGAETVLLTTAGFGDVLEIGSQARPDLFALDIRKPAPLYEHVIEVTERISAAGDVLTPLDLSSLEAKARELRRRGVRVAAVAFLNSYANAAHENAAGELLRRLGFEHVSCSAELSPSIKYLQRAQTAVVNAYLAPVIRGYISRVEDGVGSAGVYVMTSAGGLVGSAEFAAKDSLLSGPAGGVCGAAAAASGVGSQRIVAFDMGGTSTDVSRYDGEFDYVFEHRVGDAELVAPALSIETVAAGGGSICSFDGDRLRVGPESAGAHPGPACYGAGGPLTITDVNVLLGRLDARRFEVPLDVDAARARLEEVLRALRGTGEQVETETLLEGFLEIADERMADAIRRVSLRRGYDPAGHAMVAFGGAGGQHACSVAHRLGIRTVVVPKDAGLLSAYGLDRAVVERFRERQILQPLSAVEAELDPWFTVLQQDALAALAEEGFAAEECTIRQRLVELRYVGQESVVSLLWGDQLGSRFEERYHELFGHVVSGREIEVTTLRVVVSSRAVPDPHARPTEGTLSNLPEGDHPRPEARRMRQRAHVDGAWRELDVFERSALDVGLPLQGPALIVEEHSSTTLETGWQAVLDATGQLLITRDAERSASKLDTQATQPESVRLELFTSRFQAIATEMGEMLQRTALSTNVKERLDYSCAILDPDGELVVNAPHIPVHLGALGLCVRRVREVLSMAPGDVVVTNHPAHGGSHLPDVTTITPVHDDAGKLIAYVASRAHHAEIGGVRPGSMPPDARCLAEEGIVLPPFHLMLAGEGRWNDAEARFREGPHPTRALADNMADLRAAVAANHRGATALSALAKEHGSATALHYMTALKNKAEARIRRALHALEDGIYRADVALDDGEPICVSITVSGDTATIDFSGTAAEHSRNLNATPAIVRSVVLYVLRLLINEPLPLNDGLLRAVKLNLPRGILNPHFPEDPTQAPAVAGGNVETSQVLAGALIRALGLAAASQGTMNNLLFGNDEFGYFETICGGAGAGPHFDGANAVHTHMTNTRITDAEIIEHRYPVRLLRFAIRRGSGGDGAHRGGDGVVRELEFLAPMSLSLLTQHRTQAPQGLAGGGAGQPGQQHLVRHNGQVEPLASLDQQDVLPGDRIVIETPGGGGWGEGKR